MMRLLAVAATVAYASGAQAQPETRSVNIAAGTPVQLATRAELSSKQSAKGDPVDLYLANDLVIDNKVAIRAGTPVAGEIAESRGTGGLGTNGHLSIAPLYIRIGNTVIRLQGIVAAKGKTGADTVVGLAALTPVISGRSAVIKAGTRIDAMTVRSVVLPIAGTP